MIETKEFLDKLSSYNLFNYLLPGVVFAVIGDWLTSYDLLQDDIVIGLFLYYFIGLVVSRLGSLIFEPLLRLAGFLQYAEYKYFMTASKKDPKIEVLSEQNNMYRSWFAMFVCLSALIWFECISQTYPWLSNNLVWLLLAGMTIMFAFAWRKQAKYIVKRIQSHTAMDVEKKEGA